jgi:hypothetical protein
MVNEDGSAILWSQQALSVESVLIWPAPFGDRRRLVSPPSLLESNDLPVAWKQSCSSAHPGATDRVSELFARPTADFSLLLLKEVLFANQNHS